MQTTVTNYYDSETLEHVDERFFIDGEEINFDEFVEFMDEIYAEDDNEEYEENCCDCEYTYEDNCCDCEECQTIIPIDKLLDSYAKRIYDNCASDACIKEFLEDFMIDILNNFKTE